MFDQFSLNCLMVVVDFRVFIVYFQGTDKALLQHSFAYIAFDYILSSSEASIDAVVEVGLQSLIQALLNLLVSKFVILRPNIEFLQKALCLKDT